MLVHARPGIDRLDLGPIAAWLDWWDSQARDDDAMLALARGQGFVVTRTQLREAGWADHDLRREVRRGSWWLPARGTASPVAIPGNEFSDRRRRHAIEAAATTLIRPGHLASGASAAVMHGLPTMAVPLFPELTGCTDDWRGRRATNHLRHAGISAEDRALWFGAPVMTIARTIVDLARHDSRSAIMAADAALREHCVTRDDLRAALSRARGWPGIRRARDVVALADGDAESPLESVVRLALHDDGFPAPQLQRVVAGYRVDFIWPEVRVILEADGRGKYDGDALWQEKKRELALRRAGYEVERVIWSDVMREWPATSRRLRQLIRR